MAWSKLSIFFFVLASTVCLFIAATPGILWFFQERLIFFPEMPLGYKDPDLNPKGLRNPGEIDLPYEDLHLKTADGLEVHAWLMRQPESEKVPTIIFFPGNAGNVGRALPFLEQLYRKTGANILILSYRGYGKSEGKPTEEGIYMDADAALNYILQDKTLNSKSVFVFGHSLGGAVATDLASRRGYQIKGLIVENTFTSVRDMLYYLFPGLRHFNLLLGALQRIHMDNEAKISSLNLPVLFITGRRDTVVPPSQMDRLFDACKSPKWRLIVKDGGHHNTSGLGGIRYHRTIKAFMETVTSTESSSQTDKEHQMESRTIAEPERFSSQFAHLKEIIDKLKDLEKIMAKSAVPSPITPSETPASVMQDDQSVMLDDREEFSKARRSAAIAGVVTLLAAFLLALSLQKRGAERPRREIGAKRSVKESWDDLEVDGSNLEVAAQASQDLVSSRMQVDETGSVDILHMKQGAQ